MRLIVKNMGRGFEGEIARLENTLGSQHGGCYSEPVSLEDVRGWLSSQDLEPEELALALVDGRLAGYAWAWVSDKEELSFTSIRLDPSMPQDTINGAARLLLSWARLSLEEWQGVRGVVDVRLGPLAGFTHSILARHLPGLESYRETGVLMRLESPRPRRAPEGARIVEVDPVRDRDALESIVNIYNDAFSIYPDFMNWNIEDAANYFRRMYKRHRMIVLQALEGSEPVGFVEAYEYSSTCGRVIGYLSLLAVSRRFQGRGVGSMLLSSALEKLRAGGVGEIVLVAVPEAVRLYMRLGFRPLRVYVKSRVPLYVLPGGPLVVEES